MSLDQFILNLGRTETPFRDRAEIFAGLKKMAQDLEAPPVVVEEEAEAPPPVEAAQAHEEAGEPDTTGQLEGEFAVPTEQVVATMINLVGVEMKLQLAYLYYAEMVRGPGRDELAELFKELAEDEANDASYFLQRIAVLTGGQGAAMPPIPSPQPMSNREDILKQLIAYEQQAIVFLKALRQQLGDNPMKFTVEEMLSEEQRHADLLWQHMPEAPKTKVAAVMRRIKSAAEDTAAGVQPLPEHTEVVLQQQQADIAQLTAEREHLIARAQELEGVAHQNAAQAESAQAEAQQAQAQAQQTQQQAEMASQQAAQAQEQAAVSSENAAQQAEAKMRLAMRIQQFRQQMADLASADPVAEEGLGFDQQAGAGSPVTPQQQAEEQAQAQEQRAQLEQAAQTDPKARKELEEAQRAEQEANQQGAQAQEEAAKVASIAGGALRRASSTASGVLRKATPTQALGKMDLPRHLAKTNPAAAVHSGVKHKMPVVASPSVLDQLSRTSFDKLNSFRDRVAKAVKNMGQHAGKGAGEAASEAFKNNATEVGRGMGRGISEHAGEVGKRAIEGGRDAVKGLWKKPSTKAAVGAVGATYAGSKVHGELRERRKEKRQERLVTALERMQRAKS